MADRHIVIAGTGRAGTTALVKLFDVCGVETQANDLRLYPNARAGLESRLAGDNSPYVVKDPLLSEDLQNLVEGGFDPSRIDAIVLPLRDLGEVVASRIENFVQHGLGSPGNLWREKRPGLQRAILAEAVHTLLVTAADHRIRVVLLGFPRFVIDADYAWECLSPVLPDVDRSAFLRAHREVARPGLVNNDRPHYDARQLALLDLRWIIVRIRRSIKNAYVRSKRTLRRKRALLRKRIPCGSRAAADDTTS